MKTKLILGLTAILCSRTMFVLFDDPEGPNLVVVLGMALILYFLSSIVTVFLLKYSPKIKTSIAGTNLKKVLLTILVQIVLAVIFYFCLR